MKASELMVDNYVDYFSENTDRWINARQLSSNDLICLLSDSGDHAEPIPITEEWLLRFGFVRIRDYPVYSLNDFRIELNLLKSEWTADLYIDRPVIKNVHQLQNLYFALTHEELKINELTT